MKFNCTRVLLPALLLSASLAFAHGDPRSKPAAALAREQKAWGIAGDAKAARRTLKIGMHDSMRFSPDRIVVRTGETVRFVVKNEGRLLHEFVVGTRDELAAHAEMMRKFPNMEHDEAYMAHVAPGEQGEVVWTFNRPGRFAFACLIPGHEAMVGTIEVGAASKRLAPR